MSFITEMIDLIVERYARCNKLALTIAVPLETKKRLGLGGNILEAGSRHLIPAGINVIDGRRIDEEEVAVNVNASRDLESRKEYSQRGSCGGINHAG